MPDDKATANITVSQVMQAAVAVLFAVGAWFCILLYDGASPTRDGLADLKTTIAQDYVRKDDLAEVKASLNRIEDKLDKKADKR